MSDKIFQSDEIERIIKRAISKNADYNSGITESELYRIAAELNISPQQVRNALQEEKDYTLFEQAKQMYLDKKRSSFREHLTAYIIINGFLVGLDYFLTGGITWSIFPPLGWGIGLAFDFVDSIYPSKAKIEAGAKKIMKSNKWKNLFENFGFKILEELQKK
ncbi:MAG: 2TM domain-containing protein [Candidatus Kapabacteria bacterium]|nr:2TM domain-containing protein [Ignavibacteriota bacterium]MCW5885076.1 2TM domain-containing protein [Candidatus Kapabacteria bacterium]